MPENKPKRKNAWETISDYFEDHYEREDRNGGDMVAVAQDAIVADNLYLAFEVDDLLNLEPTEFKREVVELLKKYQ